MTEQKKEVYGITVNDPSLNYAIEFFRQQHGLKSKTEAAREMIRRYSIANNREKAAIEKRLHWIEHRNLGFRRLTNYMSEASK